MIDKAKNEITKAATLLDTVREKSQACRVMKCENNVNLRLSFSFCDLIRNLLLMMKVLTSLEGRIK
jgi:hypothetical protein